MLTLTLIHSIGMCRIRRFLAVLRSFFHFSVLYNIFCHPSPPTILPSSLTPSCHLFLGLPLNLVVPKFIYNTLLGILFSSILCTCPNQHNLCSLIVSVISFTHSIGTCRIRRFFAVLSSFFPSSLLCTFSCHPSPPTILPSPHLAIYFLVYLSILLFPNSYIIPFW